MSIRRYGVLRAEILDRRHAVPENPHYQIHAHDGDGDWRVSVNVRSQDRSDLMVVVDDDFCHPILEDLLELKPGWHRLPTKPGGIALDYIRGNLVDPAQMRTMPFFLPGPSNDLNEVLDSLVTRLRADRQAGLFAFGERWGPENHPDKIFGFLPGSGVHDVHMNQGNERRRAGSDGTWQDGALLFHYPGANRWVGVFLAFQSQSWQTDDHTGHRLPGAGASIHSVRRGGRIRLGTESTTIPDTAPPLRLKDVGILRIVAYIPSPQPSAPAQIILLNVSPQPIDLEGWQVMDETKTTVALGGTALAGGVITLKLPDDFQLDKERGWTLTILDREGMRVDGVRCSRGDLAREGWAVLF
jgi:uncharacterized protein YukJ